MKLKAIIAICVMFCGLSLWGGAYIARRGNNPVLKNMLVPAAQTWVEKFGDKAETHIVFNIKRLEWIAQKHELQIKKLESLIGDPNGNDNKNQKDGQKDGPQKKRWPF